MIQVKEYKQCIREKSFETICERDCFNCKFPFYFGKEKFTGSQIPIIIKTGDLENGTNIQQLRPSKENKVKTSRRLQKNKL